MHTQLPVTLMLGMATSPSALQELLPLAAVASLRLHHFKLTRSMNRVESIFSEARP